MEIIDKSLSLQADKPPPNNLFSSRRLRHGRCRRRRRRRLVQKPLCDGHVVRGRALVSVGWVGVGGGGQRERERSVWRDCEGRFFSVDPLFHPSFFF